MIILSNNTIAKSLFKDFVKNKFSVLEVKIHLEILSDGVIFLLLRLLGVWVEPLGV